MRDEGRRIHPVRPAVEDGDSVTLAGLGLGERLGVDLDPAASVRRVLVGDVEDTHKASIG